MEILWLTCQTDSKIVNRDMDIANLSLDSWKRGTKLAEGKCKSGGICDHQLSTLRWSIDNLDRGCWRGTTTTFGRTFTIKAGQMMRQKLLKKTLGVFCSIWVYTTIFMHKNCHLTRQLRMMQITIITQVVLLTEMQEFLYKDEHFFRNVTVWSNSYMLFWNDSYMLSWSPIATLHQQQPVTKQGRGLGSSGS